MKRFLLLVMLMVWGAGTVLAQDTPAPATPPATDENQAPATPPPALPEQSGAPVHASPPAGRSSRPVPPTQTPAQMGGVVNKDKHSVGIISFQGAPIQAVAEYYAQNLVHRTLIWDPSVPVDTKIYFQSPDLTAEEAQAALDTVFTMNKISLNPMGDKLLKVVPIGTAIQENLTFAGDAKSQRASDALMTQVIWLKYADPTEVAAVLGPYSHAAYAKLQALPKSGCILITETAANVNQMLEIIKYLDVPSALKMETRVYTIRHAKAADVVQRLQSIIQGAQELTTRNPAATGGATPVIPAPPGGGRPAISHPNTTSIGTAEDAVIEGKVIITADDRTNKMIVLSRESNYAFFDRIIDELDTKVDPDVTMKVFLLNYASAEDTASLINSLVSGGSPTFSSRRSSTSSSSSTSSQSTSRPTISSAPPPPIAVGGGAGGNTDSGFLQFAQGVRILPDPRTNGLLIMATKEDMLRIEQMIKDLDTPVAQVLIEVVIAEVTLDNELDVGVDVFKRLYSNGQVSQTGGSSTDGNTPVQLPKPGDAVSSLMTNLPTAALLGAGSGGLTYFATFRNLNLDGVLHALASTGRSKVLSTPIIQTMDNQEASILVGESVPVPQNTQSALISSTGTLAANSAVTASIDYRDVAIELKVTPRVNPDGYVRMDITQKVNDLGASVNISGTQAPTILKREASSSVAVEDKSTITLGGLIKETKATTETRVPILGDIPFIGQLFKSQTNSKIRNELIIFIRPTVMRTDAAAVAEARRRAFMLKASGDLQLEKQFKSDNLVPPPTELPRNTTPPAPAPVPPPSPVTGTETPTSTIDEQAREAAKIKALQEQTEQPVRQGN